MTFGTKPFYKIWQNGLFWRRVTATFVIIVFTLFDAVRYAPQGYASPSVVMVDPGSVFFSIPKELGKIDEVYFGSRTTTHAPRNVAHGSWPVDQKTIVFIQDAHDSLEAQENIAKIINLLVKEKGIKTVFEEGYEGPVPTDKFFGFIKDPAIKQKVSYFLLDKLRIGGAEYAHINRAMVHAPRTTEKIVGGPGDVARGTDWQLIGVEDLKLYGEDIRSYRDASKSKKDTGEDLKELLSQVSTLTDRYFPKALKTWLKVKERFEEGKLPLLNYLKELQAFYPQDRGPATFVKNYPAVSLLLAAQTSRDPELIKQLNALDSVVVFGEIQRLERDISGAYLGAERERRIFTYYQALSLLNRLNRIELTQPEYEAIKETLQKFETQKLADFIVSLTHRSLVLSKEWERHIKDAIQFYEIALQRDHVLEKALDNYLLGDMIHEPRATKKKKHGAWTVDHGADMAILVYGGFHANSIKELLQAKGISYAVITPAMTGIDKKHQEDYKELMSVGHYAFEVPFLAARANRPPSIFFSAAVVGEETTARTELRAIASSVEALGVHSATPLIEQRLSAFDQTPSHPGQMAGLPRVRSEMREVKPTVDPDASVKTVLTPEDKTRITGQNIEKMRQALQGVPAPMEAIEKVMRALENESVLSSAEFREFYENVEHGIQHSLQVVRKVFEWAKDFGFQIDAESLAVGAFLHDIKGLDASGHEIRKNHHITGAETAINILEKWNWTKGQKDKVEEIIREHRGVPETYEAANYPDGYANDGQDKPRPNSLEANLVRDADTYIELENLERLKDISLDIRRRNPFALRTQYTLRVIFRKLYDILDVIFLKLHIQFEWEWLERHAWTDKFYDADFYYEKGQEFNKRSEIILKREKRRWTFYTDVLEYLLGKLLANCDPDYYALPEIRDLVRDKAPEFFRKFLELTVIEVKKQGEDPDKVLSIIENVITTMGKENVAGNQQKKWTALNGFHQQAFRNARSVFRSEARGEKTDDFSALERLQDHFSVPKKISWTHEERDEKGRLRGTKTIEVLVQYDDLNKAFEVRPAPSMRQRYGAELQALDMTASQEEIGPAGSFGMITVVQRRIDGEFAVVFDEIHPSRGFRKLKPARMLRLFKPWSEVSIAEMVRVLKDAGVRQIYASHPERIKARYIKLGVRIPEPNLALNYVYPFQDKGWEPAEVEISPEGKVPEWHLRDPQSGPLVKDGSGFGAAINTARSEMRKGEDKQQPNGPSVSSKMNDLLRKATDSEEVEKFQEVERNGQVVYFVKTNKGIFRLTVTRAEKGNVTTETVMNNAGGSWWIRSDLSTAEVIAEPQDAPIPEPYLMSDIYLDTSWTNRELSEMAEKTVEGIIAHNDYTEDIQAALRELVRAVASDGPIEPLLQNTQGGDASYWNEEVLKDILRDHRTWKGDVPQNLAVAYFFRSILEKVRYWGNKKDPFAPMKQQALNEFLTSPKGLPDLMARFVKSGTADRLSFLLDAGLWSNNYDPSNPIDPDSKRNYLIDHREAIIRKFQSRSVKTLELDTDNVGPEIVSDLWLAQYLLDSSLVERVIFNVRNYPFLVSDTTQKDVDDTLAQLKASPDEKISRLGHRLEALKQEAKLVVSTDPFSTSGMTYDKKPGSLKDRSDLIFVNGDWNYRLVTGNRRWGIDQAMNRVIRSDTPVVIRRTVKSDTVIGADRAAVAALAAKDPYWFRKGRGGMLQYVEPEKTMQGDAASTRTELRAIASSVEALGVHSATPLIEQRLTLNVMTFPAAEVYRDNRRSEVRDKIRFILGHRTTTSDLVLVNLIAPKYKERWQEPLAVETLAAYMRVKIPAASVSIVDMNQRLREWEKKAPGRKGEWTEQQWNDLYDAIFKEIKEKRPRVVGLSAKWGSLVVLNYLVKKFKEMGDDRPLIVLGNTLPTFGYRELLEQDELQDYGGVIAVAGDGEEPLEKIYDKALSNTEYRDMTFYREIPGVAFVDADSQRVVFNKPQKGMDLEDYPDITEEHAVELFQDDGTGYYGIETSRGCPYGHCTFCSIQGGFGAIWRPFPLKWVFDRIDKLIKNGAKAFYIVDSEFVGPVKEKEDFEHSMDRVEEFANHMIEINKKRKTMGKKPVPIRKVSVRADNVAPFVRDDPEETKRREARVDKVFRLLRRAGVEKLYLGIESGDPEQLRHYGKGVTVEQNRKAIENVRRWEFDLEVGFIFIDPQATIPTLSRNLEFIGTTRLFETDSRLFGSLRIQQGSPYAKIRVKGEPLTTGPMKLDNLSYDSNYQDPNVPEIQKIIENWEKVADGTIKYLGRIKKRFYFSVSNWKITQPVVVEAVKIIQDILNAIFKILHGLLKWRWLNALNFNGLSNDKNIDTYLLKLRKLDFDFVKGIVDSYLEAERAPEASRDSALNAAIDAAGEKFVAQRAALFNEIEAAKLVDAEGRLMSVILPAARESNKAFNLPLLIFHKAMNPNPSSLITIDTGRRPKGEDSKGSRSEMRTNPQKEGLAPNVTDHSSFSGISVAKANTARFLEASRATFEGVYKNPAWAGRKIALLGAGSVAREEMTYNSDVDVFIVFDSKQDDQQLFRDQFISAIQERGYNDIDAWTGTVEEFQELCRGNPFDAEKAKQLSFIIGDSNLYSQIQATPHYPFLFNIEKDPIAVVSIFFDAWDYEREHRNLESLDLRSIKKGWGMMRDILTICMIGKTAFRSLGMSSIEVLNNMRKNGTISASEFEQLELALDFFLRVRETLHKIRDESPQQLIKKNHENPQAGQEFLKGRDMRDVITHDFADRLAPQLGLQSGEAVFKRLEAHKKNVMKIKERMICASLEAFNRGHDWVKLFNKAWDKEKKSARADQLEVLRAGIARGDDGYPILFALAWNSMYSTVLENIYHLDATQYGGKHSLLGILFALGCNLHTPRSILQELITKQGDEYKEIKRAARNSMEFISRNRIAGDEKFVTRSEMRQDFGQNRSFFAISPTSSWMRLLDLTTVMIAAIPSMALLAVLIPLIKIANPKMSWLFQQKRVGFRGKPFTIFELRSLDRKNEPIKLFEFPLGSFLKYSGIDELPQLWNILKGEMTIYGPRPHQELVIRESGFEKEYRDEVLAARIPGFLSLYASEIGPGRGPEQQDDFRRIIDLNNAEMNSWGPGMMAEIVRRTGWKILGQLSGSSASSQARSEMRDEDANDPDRPDKERLTDGIGNRSEVRTAVEEPEQGFVRAWASFFVDLNTIPSQRAPGEGLSAQGVRHLVFFCPLQLTTGGVQTYQSNMIKALLRTEKNLTIDWLYLNFATAPTENSLKNLKTGNGLVLHGIPARTAAGAVLSDQEQADHVGRSLEKIHAREPIQLIALNSSTPHFQMMQKALSFANRFSVASQYFFHGGPITEGVRYLIRHADTAVTGSKAYEKVFSGLGIENVGTLYPVTDMSYFSAARTENDRRAVQKLKDQYGLQGRKVILHPGRITPRKGQEVTIRAVAALIKKDPGLAAKVVVVIVGPERDPAARERFRLRQLARQLGVDVIFVEDQPSERMRDWYDLSSMAVYPTLGSEPFGIVSIEGQASGVPVIVSDGGGLPETLENGKTGFVTRRGDPQELAERIRELVIDEGKRDRMAEAGRRFVDERFALSVTLRDLTKAYLNAFHARLSKQAFPSPNLPLSTQEAAVVLSSVYNETVPPRKEISQGARSSVVEEKVVSGTNLVEELRRSWWKKFDESRVFWEQTQTAVMPVTNDRKVPLAYDPALVPMRKYGPFQRLLLPKLNARPAVSVNRDAESLFDNKESYDAESAEKYFQDPFNPDYFVRAGTYPKVEFDSLIVTKKWQKQWLTEKALDVEFGWVRAGAVTEFHRSEAFVPHMHLHLYPPEVVPMAEFRGSFVPEEEAGDVSIGKTGYPVPHIALRSGDSKALRDAALQLAESLEAERQWFIQSAFLDANGRDIIVMFFIYKKESQPVAFSPVGFIKAKSAALDDAMPDLMRDYFGDRTAFEALKQRLWAGWKRSSDVSVQSENRRATLNWTAQRVFVTDKVPRSGAVGRSEVRKISGETEKGKQGTEEKNTLGVERRALSEAESQHFDPPLQSEGRIRPDPKNRAEMREDKMVKAIRKSVQLATVFVDAEDFPNLSLAQKNEYFYAALSGRGVRIVVYNERGQVQDKELGALLKLDRVTRTDRDLAGSQISFDRPGAPSIHLSKKILPSQELVQRLRKKVSFFKTQGQNGGTLAAALLWAWSGGEDARLREISRGRDGFWIVAESLVNALQRSYDATLAFAVAA
ncbi:MAG: ARMT1-like domain-containing protein [Candidatus Omnitrophota bacterium]